MSLSGASVQGSGGIQGSGGLSGASVQGSSGVQGYDKAGKGGKGITYAAQPGRVVKPKITVTGPGGEIAISAVTAVMEIGKIPIASITAPPEFSEGLMGSQTNEEWKIKVAGSTVFTGYVGGPSGHMTAESVSHSNSLIHLTRDLDQSRMWSPGIHPLSQDDWTYYLNISGNNGGDAEAQTLAGENFDVKKDLAEETVKAMKTMLENVQKVKKISAYGNVELIQESAANVIPYLDRIYPKVSCKLNSDISDASEILALAAGTYMGQIMTESRNSRRSVWETLQLMVSHFGMTTVCDAEGKVGIVPIAAGCTPPEGNYIDDDWITGYDYNSVYTRNIDNVILVSYAATINGGGGGGGGVSPEEGEGETRNITKWAVYPEKRDTSIPGSGALVLPIPRWLTPEVGRVGNLVEADIPQSVMLEYAKSVYFEYKHMGRGVKLITPFCPSAMPGTTVSFLPASKMKAYSGKKVDQGPKAGYLWKVIHSADVESKTFLTEWHIRSIYLQSEFDKMLEYPALFGKESKPFSL